MVTHFNNFEEFKDIYENKININFKDPVLFVRHWYFMSAYKKSNKWYKRIFCIKDFDSDNCSYGYILSPITKIECLCHMIEEIDIEYKELTAGKLYRCRVPFKNIYHYE